MKKLFLSESLPKKDSGRKQICRVMKLTASFLLLCSCFAFAGHANSQNAKVSLNKTKVQLQEILNEIEEQTDYLFISNRDVNLKQKVSVSAKDESVQEVLSEVLKNTGLTFTIEGVNIILTRKEDSLLTTQQQSKNISGKIVDQNDEPIVGANIVEKGTTNGIISNQDGNFSLHVASGATLIVSYIGYRPQEIKVDNRSIYNLVLHEDMETLDEVVVVGYGTAKKRDLTGAVSSIKAEQLQNDQPETIQDMLRSGVAGLAVGLATDTKGNTSLQVRGKNSIKAGTSPLIVLDGVIYPGEITDINPNDIEQVDVLKDASSAAVYGAKAASGVVLITTKKGRGEKPSINFSGTWGLSFKNDVTDVYGADEFATYRRDLLRSINVKAEPHRFTNPNELPSDIGIEEWMGYTGATGDPEREWLQRLAFKDVEMQNYLNGNSVDWESEVFRNVALRQDYSLSASGKKKDISYYTSVNYISNKDNVVGGGYDAVRVRLNLESKVSNFITFGTNTQFANRDESAVPVDWEGYRKNTPFGSIYEEDGKYKLYPSDDNQAQNPFIDAHYTKKKNDITNLNASFYLRLDLPFGFSLQTTYSPRYEFAQEFEHKSSQHPIWSKTNGSAKRHQRKDFYWQWDNLLKWNKIFGKHALDATFLLNWEKMQKWRNTIETKDFDPNDVLGWGKIDAGLTPQVSSDDEYRTGDAMMGRLAYVYDNRYLLTLTLRRDGYSAFGQENPRATFPSVALGWVFSEERFFNCDWMNYGKLRLSWGKNGNRDIGVYSALMDMSTRKYFYIDVNGNYYDVNGFFANRMANSALKWETTTAVNGGVDFSFLNSRIDGSLDVYLTKTNDLLNSRQLPNVIGYQNITSNIGEIRNKGFEVSLRSVNIESKNFTWRTTFNLSYNKNRIKHLYGDMVDIVDENGNVVGQKEADDVNNKLFIGHSLDDIWGLEVIGVWQENEAEEAAKYGVRPGDFKVLDIDGDYKYTQKDHTFQGTKTPKVRWNMRNDFTIFRDFHFSFTLYSALGSKRVYNRAKNTGESMDRQNWYKIPYWTPENPINDYARLNSGQGGASFDVYRNNSFIRLDNISIGYTVPTTIISKFRMEQLKLSATMKNAACWAPHWKDGDPENSTIGANTSRLLYLGLNITF